jgi:hypothetical protein
MVNLFDSRSFAHIQCCHAVHKVYKVSAVHDVVGVSPLLSQDEHFGLQLASETEVYALPSASSYLCATLLIFGQALGF